MKNTVIKKKKKNLPLTTKKRHMQNSILDKMYGLNLSYHG